MNFNNLNINTRLGVAFGGLLMLLGGVAALGFHGIGQTFGSVENIYGKSVVPMHQLGAVQYLATRNRILAMDMILNTKAENVAKRAAELKANIGKVDIAMNAYHATDITAAEKELVKELDSALKDYRTQGLDPISEAALAGNKEEAEKLYATKLSPLAPKVFDSLEKLVEVQVALAKGQFDGASSANTTTKNLTMGLAAAALALGALLAWLIARS